MLKFIRKQISSKPAKAISGLSVGTLLISSLAHAGCAKETADPDTRPLIINIKNI